MDDRMTTPWGELALTRFPEDPRDPLRAWDAADEYLLRHLAARGRAALSGTVVVVGDRWGALATALAAHRPVADHRLLPRARRRPGRTSNAPASSPDRPAARPRRTRRPSRIDVLLVRVPKSLALLEDQLLRLAPAVHEGTRRRRHRHGEGDPHLDAQAVRADPRADPHLAGREEGPADLLHPGPVARPDRQPLAVQLHAARRRRRRSPGRTVVNHAGRLLRRPPRHRHPVLPPAPAAAAAAPERIVDLGCGNGVVGTAVALANPEAEVLFIDESYQAVASAEATFRANGGRAPRRSSWSGTAWRGSRRAASTSC